MQRTAHGGTTHDGGAHGFAIIFGYNNATYS